MIRRKTALPVALLGFTFAISLAFAADRGRNTRVTNLTSTSATPGLQIGSTFHDMQKHGSMGRQIATRGSNHIINFSWTHKSSLGPGFTQNVRYETWDPAIGVVTHGAGGIDVGANDILPNFAGFSTMDGVDPSGLSVVALEWSVNFPIQIIRPYVFYNATPSFGDFTGAVIPDAVWTGQLTGNATTFIWPQVAYTNDGAGTEVTHLLIFSDRTDGDGEILYTRKVGSGLAGTWTTATLIGSGGFHRSGVVLASRKPTSQKVAIAWTGGRGDGTEFGASTSRFNGLPSGQRDNDVYYMTSADAGASWSATHNITQRADSLPGGFAPHAKLSGLFDASDDLNIAWQTAEWNGYGGAVNTRGRIHTWTESAGLIRTAVDALWDQPNCDGGESNLNVSNPQLSECDTKLYLTFTQFNNVPNGIDDDCASRAPGDPTGAANGEIMVTISSNGGFNWDADRNLTLTYTPNCDTIPGGIQPDCESEVWHSATRYGIDITADIFGGIPDLTANIDAVFAGADYIFVQYVSDEDPGAAVSAEGGWTFNPVKTFRFGCVEVVTQSILASSLPQGQAIALPDPVPPGTSLDTAWRLENIGNAAMVYSISIFDAIPPGNVAVLGATGTISAGIVNFEDLTIRLNAGLETTPQTASATIIVNGNFVTSPDTFFVDYQISGSGASNFEFEQQSFLDETGTVVDLQTRWGRAVFTVIPTTGDTVRYLNITAAIGVDTGWIVRNYPILPDTYIDSGMFVIDFDLILLGISDGTLVTSLDYYSQVTDNLLFTGPTGPFITAPVNRIDIMTFGFVLEAAGSPFNGPGPLTPAYFTAPVELDSLQKYKGMSHKKIPSVQEDSLECASGATARSLKWLSNEHGLGLGSAKSIQERLDDADMMPAPGPNLKEVIAAKKKYIKDNNLPLEVHYWYANSYYGANPAWHNTPGTPSESSSDIDMVEWLWKEMKKGQDIEVGIIWGDGSGGHLVTLVGVDKKNKKIEYRDDEHQGDDAKGDKGIKEAQLVGLGSGEYGYKGATNKIVALFAESPAFPVWDCVHSTLPGTFFSPSLWTLDGEVIGQTFPDGIIPTPGVVTYDSTTLPARPNDWHWSMDFIWNEIPVTIWVWFVNFSPGADLSFEVYCPTLTGGFPPGLMYLVDVGADSYIVSDSLDFVLFTGVWSLYPSDLPPGFDSTGMQRTNTAPTGCCVTPGDFNNNGAFNIADVTSGIARIFTPGAPAPSCQDQADFNSDGVFNIGDVTAGIARIFVPGSPAPVCGTTGI